MKTLIRRKIIIVTMMMMMRPLRKYSSPRHRSKECIILAFVTYKEHNLARYLARDIFSDLDKKMIISFKQK